MTTTGELISQTGDTVDEDWFKTLNHFSLNKNLAILQALVNRQPLTTRDFHRVTQLLHSLNIPYSSSSSPDTPQSLLYPYAAALLITGEKPERIGEALDWNGFEHMVSIILDLGGYETRHTLRFKTLYKEKREIDVIAWSKPWVWLLDCKHWSAKNTNRRSMVHQPTQKQAQRVMELLEAMHENAHLIPWYAWENARLIPALVTLWDDGETIVNGMPVLPFNHLVKRMQYYQDNPQEITYYEYEGLGIR